MHRSRYLTLTVEQVIETLESKQVVLSAKWAQMEEEERQFAVQEVQELARLCGVVKQAALNAAQWIARDD